MPIGRERIAKRFRSTSSSRTHEPMHSQRADGKVRSERRHGDAINVDEKDEAADFL